MSVYISETSVVVARRRQDVLTLAIDGYYLQLSVNEVPTIAAALRSQPEWVMVRSQKQSYAFMLSFNNDGYFELSRYAPEAPVTFMFPMRFSLLLSNLIMQALGDPSMEFSLQEVDNR